MSDVDHMRRVRAKFTRVATSRDEAPREWCGVWCVVCASIAERKVRPYTGDGLVGRVSAGRGVVRLGVCKQPSGPGRQARRRKGLRRG